MPSLLPQLDVSRETFERLHHFSELLAKWTKKINLISRDSQSDIWERHILDSAQLFPLIQGDSRHYLDIGSGGGLPGIVLAVLFLEKMPDAQITLVESDQRKCAFLRTACRELGIDATIKTSRIEAIPPQNAHLLTARALAPLNDLLALLTPHLSENGIALLPKGRNNAEELEIARRHWHFNVTAHQSVTSPEARILEIKDITRVANSE